MTRETSRPARAESSTALWEQNGATIDAFMKAGEAMWSAWANVGQELMDFSNACLRRTIESSDSLMRCGDAREAFRLQCDFAQSSTEQYFEEATRLLDLTAKATRECWAPFEDSTETPQREHEQP